MRKVNRWDYVVRWLIWGEDTLAIVILFVMTMLPFLASITRVLNKSSIPASQVLVQHCTLWIGFLGAVLAARKNKLLALTRSPLFKKEEKFKKEGLLSGWFIPGAIKDFDISNEDKVVAKRIEDGRYELNIWNKIIITPKVI